MNTTSFPPSTERPDRSNRYNIDTSLVSNAVALQKESTSFEKQYNHASKHAFKQNANVSYDVEDKRLFLTLNNKKTKLTEKTETAANDLASHDTFAIASLSNDDYTIPSSFNHEEFLKKLEERNNKLRSEIETLYNQKI